MLDRSSFIGIFLLGSILLAELLDRPVFVVTSRTNVEIVLPIQTF